MLRYTHKSERLMHSKESDFTQTPYPEYPNMPPLKADSSVDSIILRNRIESEMEVDYDKNITRLYESISSSDWDVAIRAVKRSPAEARTWVVRHHESDEYGERKVMWRFLPIHSACARQPPENVISALLRAYPDGARAQDDQGMFPLHYACGNQASLEVIRLLLLSYPQAASIADPNDMLPIHYLAQWGPSSLKVVEMLLFSNRSVAHAKDIDGNTALDMAYEAEYPERKEVIEILEKFTKFSETEKKKSPTPTIPRTPLKQTIARPDEDEDPLCSAQTRSDRSYPSPSLASKSLMSVGSASKSRSSSKDRKEIPIAVTVDEPSIEKNQSEEETIISVSTMKQLAKLKAEVNKLRAEQIFAQAEMDEKLLNEREANESSLQEVKNRLASVEQECQTVKSELSAKEEFCQYVESRLAEKDYELTAAQKQVERLKAENKVMKEQCDEAKVKSEVLHNRFLALTNSLNSMMEDQESIMSAAASQEEAMKKASILRQKKLQELIDQEVMLAKESQGVEKHKGSSIIEAMENQNSLMRTVASIVKEISL